jgi:hypothetical protein
MMRESKESDEDWLRDYIPPIAECAMDGAPGRCCMRRENGSRVARMNPHLRSEMWGTRLCWPREYYEGDRRLC